MFVDTSASHLEALKWLLQDEPYYVFACDDPIEALNLIRLAEFAVIVADQSLQKMSGWEFMQRVKERSPDTVGILITDNMPTAEETGAINQNNVHEFVKKPIDNGKIKHAVANAIIRYDINIESGRGKRPCQ